MRRRWLGWIAALAALASSVAAIVFAYAPLRDYHESHYSNHSNYQHPTGNGFAALISAIEVHHDLLLVFETFALVAFTGTLWWSTRRLWQETSTHARHMGDTVEISRAQVRAYVSISGCGLNFIEAGAGIASPIVSFTAVNNGQSPARNFIWNVTLEYVYLGMRRRRQLTDRWETNIGSDIPAGSTTSIQSAYIPDMTTRQLENDCSETTLVVIVKIDFFYRDVFNEVWRDNAFFSGLMTKEVDINQWSARISPTPRPSDWPETTSGQQQTT